MPESFASQNFFVKFLNFCLRLELRHSSIDVERKQLFIDLSGATKAAIVVDVVKIHKSSPSFVGPVTTNQQPYDSVGSIEPNRTSIRPHMTPASTQIKAPFIANVSANRLQITNKSWTFVVHTSTAVTEADVYLLKRSVKRLWRFELF